jgi:hypothetical protein
VPVGRREDVSAKQSAVAEFILDQFYRREPRYAHVGVARSNADCSGWWISCECDAMWEVHTDARGRLQFRLDHDGHGHR